jgi:diadenosine tetraphosphate (Ap4A) HIT family hydrolase
MTENSPKLCPFCTLPATRVVEENRFATLILDGFPISPGHCLIIPKRHVGSIFEVTEAEHADLFALLNRAKELTEQRHKPDGYNIGINDGAAAGQTVPHLHIHLIPRYAGDLPDPRGGVRWVIPNKADYWSGQ